MHGWQCSIECVFVLVRRYCLRVSYSASAVPLASRRQSFATDSTFLSGKRFSDMRRHTLLSECINELFELTPADQSAVFLWLHTCHSPYIAHLKPSICITMHCIESYLMKKGILLSDIEPFAFFQHLRASTVDTLFSQSWLMATKQQLYGSNLYPLPLEPSAYNGLLSNGREMPEVLRRRQVVIERNVYEATRRIVEEEFLKLSKIGKQTEKGSVRRQWYQWIPEMKKDIDGLRSNGMGPLVFPQGLDSTLLAIIAVQVTLQATYKPMDSAALGKQGSQGALPAMSVPLTVIVTKIGKVVNHEFNASVSEGGLSGNKEAPYQDATFADYFSSVTAPTYDGIRTRRREGDICRQRWSDVYCVSLGSALFSILLKHATITLPYETVLQEMEEERRLDELFALKLKNKTTASNKYLSTGDTIDETVSTAMDPFLKIPTEASEAFTQIVKPHETTHGQNPPSSSFETKSPNRKLPKYLELPVFRHRVLYNRLRNRNYGAVELRRCCSDLFSTLPEVLFNVPFQPMVCRPKQWTSLDRGGHLLFRTPLIRWTGPTSYLRHIRAMDLSRIYSIVNAIGEVPWRINTFVLEVMQEAWGMGLDIEGLPKREEEAYPPAPTDAACYRQHREVVKQIAYANAVQRSQKPTFLLKLNCANVFRASESLYFPHNLDFRGRLYPLSPHLNHLGSDVSRGLLTFGQTQALGSEGYRWLSIHLANLFGRDKLPFEERLHWVEAHEASLRRISEDPLDEAVLPLWQHLEKPWQALACCYEWRRATDCLDPSLFESSLPIHQDGSCNGLQHYAALGRDVEGGRSVNLLPSLAPADVYSRVLEVTRQRIDEDRTRESHPLAQLCFEKDVLIRKVVKTTVMTVCYGVTRAGAKSQVKGQLMELLGRSVEADVISKLAGYIAHHLLSSIGDIFRHAMAIKQWLDEITRLSNGANIPMLWVSPMGLPCQQPYSKYKSKVVSTPLQSISVQLPLSTHSLDKLKQRLGFPPNFIHSLDASHMMMTAEKCLLEDHISFVAVHDSFWAHAGNIPIMNRRLREQFVELYTMPILKDLYISMRQRLGASMKALREPPPLGELDIHRVMDSPYFFH